MDRMGLVFALLALSVVSIGTAEECAKVSKCKCQTPSGTTVDLNPLTSCYSARGDKGIYEYQISPCKPLAQSTCSSTVSCLGPASVCQTNIANKVSYDAGDDDSQVFAGDPAAGTLKVTYKTTTIPPRSTVVNVVCSESTGLEFVSESPNTVYNFKLRTPIICPPSDDSGPSVGSILVILFFVFFVVYWVGGFIFMKFVRRAEGLEVIPNYEFWKELPLVIRDGVMFTFRGCKGESTYEKI